MLLLHAPKQAAQQLVAVLLASTLQALQNQPACLRSASSEAGHPAHPKAWRSLAHGSVKAARLQHSGGAVFPGRRCSPATCSSGCQRSGAAVWPQAARLHTISLLHEALEGCRERAGLAAGLRVAVAHRRRCQEDLSGTGKVSEEPGQ